MNIEVLTLCEVQGIEGQAGNFTVSLLEHPRYIDKSRCIACGVCAQKCPKKVASAYDAGLKQRRAAYVSYAQAVPLKYAIDADNCIYFIKGKCRACEKVCPVNAVCFDDEARPMRLQVGAVIVTAGGAAYDPATHDTFDYQRAPNVLTALEFERILSASGPYGGHLVRPSDRREPASIAWLQCIGSRDTHLPGRDYCSAVCCTYAVKEAMLAREHSAGNLDTAMFYIDMRTAGKDFEAYLNRARGQGLRLIKSRITRVETLAATQQHKICYVDETGRAQAEIFDMVVLSVGLGLSPEGRQLAQRLGLKPEILNGVEGPGLSEFDPPGMDRPGSFAPVETGRPGIYSAGLFQAPKDIPAAVVDASAAAACAGNLLVAVREQQTRTREQPAEMDLRGQAPRIGVLVCRCGTNIAATVDVPGVVAYARSLPYVVHVEENMFSCSQDSQENLTRIITANQLNRIVVAACTPRTHEPLFQETLMAAGLNKYLFEMANIRNQCSWVHQPEPEAATRKACDLVGMAVAKAALLQPLAEPTIEIDQKVLVVGGGVAGLTAAWTLALQGYQIYLVEKASQLGGNARYLSQTWQGEAVPPFLADLIARVQEHPRIEVLLDSTIGRVDGFVGCFKSHVIGTTAPTGQDRELTHGVTLLATGATELKPAQYAWGEDPRVISGLELQRRLGDQQALPDDLPSVTFIQCVGSRIPERPWCSRLCCTQSVQGALQLKQRYPSLTVNILYRDLRTYGLRERLYRQARDQGVRFMRYDAQKPLQISPHEHSLTLQFTDRTLKRSMQLDTHLLVLAAAIVPEDQQALARLYKVSVNADGFFTEAHVKLRPVDFATDGVFMCGLAHAPKPLDESIAQAQAAAGRAASLLGRKQMRVSGTVARVTSSDCSACGVCISICPYNAPRLNTRTAKAEIEAGLCKGCGLCVASCRSEALQLSGFETSQIMGMIAGAL